MVRVMSRSRRKRHWVLNPFALFIAALLFLCLPALFAFAGADEMPSSKRSDTAYARNAPELTRDLMAAGFTLGDPLYLRITKQPAELSAYIRRDDGTYHHFRSWPVCAASGGLGPKKAEGDGKSPEGFYAVAPGQMNPASTYHLSFNLGYPNAHDRQNGYTGSFLMVHGKCVSIGCYAMTDPAIEEIWTLMQAAFAKGQREVPVHIFPFEMTAANLQAHAGQADAAFWRSLAPAWNTFEQSGRVPDIGLQSGHYVVDLTQ